jgi:hypothetical protein
MSAKKILTVGFDIASDDVHFERFDRKLSLLDWDIILIKPEIGNHYSLSYAKPYRGKPCLDDDTSFRVKDRCEHWRREIKDAVDAGKTVIVFLSPLDEVFVATGERTVAGTGPDRRVTRKVSIHTNYHVIPANIVPVNTSGALMKLVAKSAEVLAPYWTEFESHSTYRVLLTGDEVPACLVTRTGDKHVGALYRSEASSGTLLLLPNIDFYQNNFFHQTGAGRDWTPAASQFAGKFVSAIVALDRALRSSSEVTPAPSWAGDPIFALGPETELRLQLLEAERRVEQAQQEKEALFDQLTAAGRHRALLYEKGKPLEEAIIHALRLMGFTASSFKESDSEFDVVFESAEGRLIGEAEGKDNKAVNIDKLRQLQMNIHEDLQREEINTSAKPVLFGNGYRLQSVTERLDPFTDKCKSAAASSSTALVHTPDLFVVVQNLLEQSDQDYAKECRRAILSSVGRVVFPERDIPKGSTPTDSVVGEA